MFVLRVNFPCEPQFTLLIASEVPGDKGIAAYIGGAASTDVISRFKYELEQTRDERGHLLDPDFLEASSLLHAIQKNPNLVIAQTEVVEGKELANARLPDIPLGSVD